MVTIPSTKRKNRISSNFILNFIYKITNRISPYWLACIPLSAIIVVFSESAAMAQGFVGSDDPAQLKIVVDSIFLLITGTLVVFMNAGFAMLEAGFCRQKNAVNILAKT